MNIHEYRFRHRFIEPDLTKRQWELDTSIDEQIKEIENLKVGFYFFAYRHWVYCAASTPMTKTGYGYDDLWQILELCHAGDIIEIWILNDNPKKFTLNCPNFDGLFPKRVHIDEK